MLDYNSMATDDVLTVSLEEFGLSRYEARIYVTLISRGTMTAGDLAYYTKIPRTKIYPTVTKLESKNLATTSNGKPVMCTAVPPEDAFDAIIYEHIEKVTAMNSLVAELKKKSEENKRSGDSKGMRYLQMRTNRVFDQLRTMIEGAESSIMIMADQWGLRLLAECRAQLVTTQRKNMDVRAIIPEEQIGSAAFRSIPNGIEVRASKITQNYMVFDATEVLILDNRDGQGAAFTSADILGSNQIGMFETLWETAIRTDVLADMTSGEAREICSIMHAINKRGLPHIIESIMRSGSTEHNLYRLLESEGIELKKRSLDDLLVMIDTIMQITCSGHASLESGSQSITVESPLNSGTSLPWAAVLDNYLQERGYSTRTILQRGAADSSNGEKTHIHLSKN